MTYLNDRFHTQIDPEKHLTATDVINHFIGEIKMEQQYFGRRDVYRELEREGVDDFIIRKIKDKFNDR